MTSKSLLKYLIITHIPSFYVNEKKVKSCPCSQPGAIGWSGSVAALISLDGSECSTSCPSCSKSPPPQRTRGRAHSTHWVESWVRPKASLDVFEKWESRVPCRNKCSAHSLVVLPSILSQVSGCNEWISARFCSCWHVAYWFSTWRYLMLYATLTWQISVFVVSVI